MHEIAEPLHHLGGLLLVPKGGSANDGVNRMQLEAEFGDYTKVTAAAADGPEEVLVFLSTDCYKAAVGQNHVRPQQVVNCKSVLARQVPMPASESQSANPGG